MKKLIGRRVYGGVPYEMGQVVTDEEVETIGFDPADLVEVTEADVTVAEATPVAEADADAELDSAPTATSDSPSEENGTVGEVSNETTVEGTEAPVTEADAETTPEAGVE